jgi:outer membrane protein OmpA-like peptidoglycan-associated protein
MKRNNVMKKAVIVVASVFVLSACTTDPYTGQRKPSKAAIGSIAGAVVGAAVSSKSDRGKGALIGAAVGGGTGLYFDNQEKKLREKLANTGVSVTREGKSIYLNMPGNLTFNTNSSDIQSSFYDVLNSVASVFKEFKKTQIQITGHTDSVGSDASNLALSQRRAQSVANYLIAQSIAPQRFYVSGMGESQPIASNDTPQGREQNRRVEVQIISEE